MDGVWRGVVIKSGVGGWKWGFDLHGFWILQVFLDFEFCMSSPNLTFNFDIPYSGGGGGSVITGCGYVYECTEVWQ